MVWLVAATQEVPGAFCHVHSDKRTVNNRVYWLGTPGIRGKQIMNPRVILSNQHHVTFHAIIRLCSKKLRILEYVVLKFML